MKMMKIPPWSTIGLILALSLGASQWLAAEQKFPDVLNVKVIARGDGVFDFDATLSSPYDSAKRYADAFRVMDRDGKVYGERVLFHDHANEQPFTRDLHGVKIPISIKRVTVQGRDQKFGYGGKTFELTLPTR
jgi:hypothetical protein